MPPKVKIAKEDIIKSAVELVRKNGVQAINARTIAADLHCSTQPVFSNFATMDELRSAVIEAADELCSEYIKREVESAVYPPYKASAIAYIRFAKEEKELFRLLYMRDRSDENTPLETNAGIEMTAIVQNTTGVDLDKAKLFHLEMWSYVHGIATMIATGYYNPDWELISKMLTDAYQGLKKQYERP